MPRVVIVGAGPAGLHCAQMLRLAGVTDVVVLEASDRAGGRVRQDYTFLDGAPLECGAEFVHGNTTLLSDYAERGDWRVRHVFTWAQGDGGPSEPAPDGGVGLYWLGGRWVAGDADDVALQRANDACWDIEAADPLATPPAHSLAEYMAARGVAGAALRLVEAGYANTAGAPLREQSLRASTLLERHWAAHDGEGDVRVEGTFAQLISMLVRGIDVRTHRPVAAIEHCAARGCVVRCADGSALRADAVVVAVPAPVMRDGDIAFQPPLPAAKTAAAAAIGMTGACKLVLRFTAPFWPAWFQGAVCEGTDFPDLPSGVIAPEFWVGCTEAFGSGEVGAPQCVRGSHLVPAPVHGGFKAEDSHPAAAAAAVDEAPSSANLCARGSRATRRFTSAGAEVEVDCDAADGLSSLSRRVWHTVTVFTTGPQATALAAMPLAEARAAVLAQLDSQFTAPPCRLPGASTTPATDLCRGAFRYDWAAHPTVRGGYSHPSVREAPTTRADAAASVGGRLFFAGEHTNASAGLTVHGAMETGVRAACEVLASFGDAAGVERVAAQAEAANARHVAETARRAAETVLATRAKL